MKRIIYIKSFAIATMIFLMFAASAAAAIGENKQFEIGFGVGTDIHSIKTINFLITPALSWQVKGRDNLEIRLEGALEIISSGDIAGVVGVAPLLRVYFPEHKSRPFVEAGGGVNLSSNDVIESRDLGSYFLFSIMAGVGISLNNDGSPIFLSYRFRHLSNGHLASPNFSFNSNYILVSTRF